MEFKTRKEENKKNIVTIMVCLVCLLGITVNLQRLEMADETVVHEIEEIQEIEENNTSLDLEGLYDYVQSDLGQEHLEEIADKLMDAEHLETVELKEKLDAYGVILTYKISAQGQSLSKAKKEQMVLVNSSILMSLFNEVDVVEIVILRGEESYQKVISRLDLEDYFGIKLVRINQRATFDRITSEFLQSEAVSAYWVMKHRMDSQIGESVEAFFKWVFPARWDEKLFPYINEALEDEVIKQYGYKLFLEGLNYDHDLINYYSAYRLMEYYGNANLDEILLELASCKQRTKSDSVKAACEAAIRTLSDGSRDEVTVFTRYGGSTLQGGKKLYAILNEKLIELAVWEGNEAGGFEVVNLSEDETGVVCKVHTLETVYLYVIPMDEVGGYKVNEQMVQRDGVRILDEIMDQIRQVVTEKGLDEEQQIALDSGEVQCKWLFDKVLNIKLEEKLNFVYDSEKNTVVTYETFLQNYDVNYMKQEISSVFNIELVRQLLQEDEERSILELTIEGEKIIVQEYDSAVEKNRMLLKQRVDIMNVADQLSIASTEKKWDKGKIIVSYDGKNEKLIAALDKIMKS